MDSKEVFLRTMTFALGAIIGFYSRRRGMPIWLCLACIVVAAVIAEGISWVFRG